MIRVSDLHWEVRRDYKAMQKTLRTDFMRGYLTGMRFVLKVADQLQLESKKKAAEER